MNLIESSYEIWEQKSPEKQIERAGRVCYKSEDKIVKGSAKKFVERMVANKHYAMLEHGTIYLKKTGNDLDVNLFCFQYANNKYSRAKIVEEDGVKTVYVTTNYRVIIENNLQEHLKYQCKPTEHHEKRITVHFTLDMGVGREFTRHRVFSFAQESTRYCNYAKEKFDGSCTFIKPQWFDTQLTDKAKCEFVEAMKDAEKHYLNLISYGLTAQQAREVLPLATKSELVMTGFESDWDHFFDLRALGTTGAPHPAAKKLAEPLMQDIKRLVMDAKGL